MKVAVISDTHCRHNDISVPEADLLIHALSDEDFLNLVNSNKSYIDICRFLNSGKFNHAIIKKIKKRIYFNNINVDHFDSCFSRRLDIKTLVINSKYSSYKSNASYRKIPFNITKEFFRDTIFKNCVYCSSPPGDPCFCRKNGFKDEFVLLNGIDRVDNTIGYNEENCVPCCANCNSSKLELSKKDFLFHVKKIYEKRMNEILSRKIDWSFNFLDNQNNDNDLMYDKMNPCSPLFRRYKYHSEKMALKYNLSMPDLFEMCISNCYYCDIAPSQILKTKYRDPFFYNGIDRVDSKFGYYKENCVPCCKTCNYMKNKNEISLFYNYIEMIYKTNFYEEYNNYLIEYIRKFR